jgi:hypothetical protein
MAPIGGKAYLWDLDDTLKKISIDEEIFMDLDRGRSRRGGNTQACFISTGPGRRRDTANSQGV